MNNKFLGWIKHNETDLLKRNIKCEIHDSRDEIIEKNLENPCQTVYFDSERKFGTVSVWKSGFMDIEILNSETEELEYSKHFDDIGLNPDFESILCEFLEKMILQ